MTGVRTNLTVFKVWNKLQCDISSEIPLLVKIFKNVNEKKLKKPLLFKQLFAIIALWRILGVDNMNEEEIELKNNAIIHKDNSLTRLDLSFLTHIELSEYKKVIY